MEDDPPMNVPDTVPSERWVPYRNPEAQERSDPSGNKREDKSSIEETTTSSAGAVDNSSSQPDETAHPKPAKRQCLRRSSRTRRAPTACYKESSDDEDLVTSDKEEDNLDYNDNNDASARKGDGSYNYNHAAWEEKFKMLVEYKNEYGTTRVPKTHPALGTWINNQRRLHKLNNLLEYRKVRLNSIGFEWNVTTMSWMEMYNQLLCYKRQHNGSTNVPKSSKGLGRWVEHQRLMYSKEKLPQNRIELLGSIGFIWDPHHAFWMEMYKKLVAYEKKYGTTRVPQRWKIDSKLGSWVHRQRLMYSKGKLSPKRIELLEYIGFIWDPLYDQWMEMYQKLVAYEKKYGSTCVPQKWGKDPKLGRWVKAQRHNCKEQYQIDLLNDIGFVWDAKNIPSHEKFREKFREKSHEKWMKMYKMLVKHKDRYGTTCVSRRENPQLWNWVKRQRQAYSKSKLTQERIDLLVEHQRKAYSKSKLSQERIDLLVKHQRQAYSKSKLSQERIDLLEAIGFQ